jgi:putative transposase
MNASYVPERYHRRSIRLRGYDYSQAGAYFVTTVVRDRRCIFGDVLDGEMCLSDAGQAARECWEAIPEHFPHVELDAFVIMPNHVHGIICIVDDVVGPDVGAKDFSPLPNAPAFRSPSKTVGSIVRGFKIGVTKWVRTHMDVYEVWQRNYYEHIIRDESSLDRIRAYIIENPARWAEDAGNPARHGGRG